MTVFKSILVGAVATAGLMAPAAPSVTVGDVKTGEPRSNSRSNGSWNLNFSAGTIVGPDELRYRGQSVRPVREGGPAATVVASGEAESALMPTGAQKIGDDVFMYVNADGALVVFGEGLGNPQFKLESLAGAIAVRTAIHEDGSL